MYCTKGSCGNGAAVFFALQVMFIQNKGHVSMSVELLDTEEAQADDPARRTGTPPRPAVCLRSVSAGIHDS